LSSPHLEASPATTFRACSSPAPTRVKPQPAPAILSQESVHTTLSITHHTRKRPSIGPRTTHGPQSPPWWVHWQHTFGNQREKGKETNKKKNSNKRSKIEKGKEQDHLKKTSLGPLRQGQRLDTSETKPCLRKEHKPPTHTRAPPTHMQTPPEQVPTLGTNRSGRFSKLFRPVTKTGQAGCQNWSDRFGTADHTPKSQKCKRNAQAPPWLLG
jgi:hypothetical protein